MSWQAGIDLIRLYCTNDKEALARFGVSILIVAKVQKVAANEVFREEIPICLVEPSCLVEKNRVNSAVWSIFQAGFVCGFIGIGVSVLGIPKIQRGFRYIERGIGNKRGINRSIRVQSGKIAPNHGKTDGLGWLLNIISYRFIKTKET